MSSIWVSVHSDAPLEVRRVEGVPVLVLAPGVHLAVATEAEADALAEAAGHIVRLHRDARRHARRGQWPAGEGAR